MRTQKTLLLFLPFLALLGACGDDSVSRRDIPREFVKLNCNAARECPIVGDSAWINAAVSSIPQKECADVLESEVRGLDLFDAEIAAGTIRYDGEAARRCLDAASNSCRSFDYFNAAPSCQQVFVGTVQTGGACSSSAECANGGYCRLSGGDVCGGTCMVGATLGESCGTNGVECSRTPEGGGSYRCTVTGQNPELHCVLSRNSEAGLDEACGSTMPATDTMVEASCKPGLYCQRGDASLSGLCKRPLAVGATCVQGRDACEGGTCSENDTCVAYTVRNSANESCDDEFIVCNPFRRLECVNSVCVQIGDGTLGARCEPDFPGGCNEGLYCNEEDPVATTPVCANLIPNGGACVDDEGCISNYCNDVDVCADVPRCD